MKSVRSFVVSALLLSLVAGARAEEKDVSAMDLNEILNMSLDVTQGRQTTREAANIVTVITASQIAASGARDLIDVLRQVPGFEFGVDVNGVVDVGMRGNWAHEGKVLLLWDGQPMNELVYGCNAFGNHYPVDQIQQIEIIRGPGSVIYGGWAELAVINIKTRGAKSVEGLSAGMTYGQMAGATGRSNASLSFGRAMGDVEIVAHLFDGSGNASDRDYTSYGGASYNFKDNNTHHPRMANLDLKYRGLDVRYISDQYRNQQRDWWGPAIEKSLSNNFDTYIFDVKYDLKVGDRLTLTPRLNSKEGTAWLRSGDGADNVYVEGKTERQDIRFETYYWRYTEELTASYDLAKNANLLVGAQSFQDRCRYHNKTVNPRLGGGYELNFDNLALYAQGSVTSLIGTITAGGRYEDHSQFGSSFVPRLGLTKVFDKVHLKALYAQAFKSPAVDTINLNPGIKPERSEFYEFEAGYRFREDMFVTANYFDIGVHDTIMYYADDYTETMLNAGNSGTKGLELEYKYLREWGFVNMSYSFYQAKNQVPYYRVLNDDSVMLGLPAHKAAMNAQYRFSKFSVGPSFEYFTERYGYERDGRGVKQFDPSFLANLYCSYALFPGLTLGAGVYDLFDASPVYVQPYNGGHSPIPGTSRELVMKIGYDLKF